MSDNDITQLAMANGYHAGFEHGASNKRVRQAFAYRHDERYQRATIGYDRGWDLQNYQNAFRQGYEKGYSDGYRQRSRNSTYEDTYIQYRDRRYDEGDDSSHAYDSREDGTIDPQSFTKRAAESGYRDGFEGGENDRRMGVRPPNPQGHDAYELGLHGWDRKWGNQSTYQQYFRQYFVQGHTDGYNSRAADFVFRP